MRTNCRHGRVWEVRTEQHMLRPRKAQEQTKGVLVGRQCEVVVQAPRILEELGRGLGVKTVVREQVCGARCDVGKRPAGVGQNNSAVGMAADGVGHDEVEGGAGGFVGIVDDGLGDLGIDECGVGGVGGMNEHDSFASVEGGPDAEEVGMPKVLVGLAVAGV